MTKITARQHILDYLRSHQGVTASELGRALRVTSANVRHHLGILENNGLVQSSSLKPSGGRGRPVKVYRLGESALGHNLDWLSDALLESLLNVLPAEGQDAALEQLSARLSGVAGEAQRAHITRRLSAVVDRFSRLNYQPRWEAHASGPRIIFSHCPYASIVEKHPQLCRMDALALAKLLSVPVEQLARLEQGERGLPVCVFRAAG